MGKRIISGIICIVLVSSFMIFNPVQAANNMVVNGSFEDGLWSLKSPESNWILDSSVSYDGIKSAKVISTIEQSMGSEMIPVDKNSSYNLMVRIKTEGISNSNGVSINILEIDSQNNSLGWYNGSMKLISTGGTQDWTMYTATLDNLRDNAVNIRVYCRIDAGVSGTAWFDAVSLNEENMVPNGSFEDGLWSLKSPGSNWILDSSVSYDGSKSAKVVSTIEQSMGSELVPVNKYDTYKLSIRIKTDSISNGSGVSINVLEVDSQNNSLGWYNGSMKLVSTGGTQNWTRYTATLHDFRSNTASIRIYCRIDASVQGTAWFDAAILETYNKVTNYGFEFGMWNIKSGGFVLDNTEEHSGLTSAKVTGSSSEQYILSTLISIGFHNEYELSAWIKTSGISTSDGISVRIMQYNAGMDFIGWYPSESLKKLISTGGTQDWTMYTVGNIGGFAENTRYLRIYLGIDPNVTGTVWFDDIVFEHESKDNFLWGVCGHNYKYNSYPADKLNDQVSEAVGMGSNIYRINASPEYNTITGVYNWAYLDNVVSTCFNNKIKIYLIIYDSLSYEPQWLYDRAKDIASRYKGKISYYQLGNEQDNQCIISSSYDGTLTSHYDDVKYTAIKDKLNALSNGIHDGDPYANRVINISYKHTGFIQRLNNDGVSWEVNGSDWYSNMGDATSTLDTFVGFPQKVIVVENDIYRGTYSSTEEQQRDYILDFSKQIYYYNSDKIIGYFVYELLDEPVMTEYGGIDTFEKDTFNWTVDDTYAPGSTFVKTSENAYELAYSGKLSYNFNSAGNNYVILNTDVYLAGTPNTVSMSVYGNNSDHVLGIRFKDCTGEVFKKEYGPVNWTGWRRIVMNYLDNPVSLGGGDNDTVVDNSSETSYAHRFNAITLNDYEDTYIGSGVIYIDLVTYTLIHPAEAHYGVIECDQYGNIGSHKLAYEAVHNEILSRD